MKIKERNNETYGKVVKSRRIKVTLLDNPYRSDFPIFKKYPRLAYLDNAATTQRPKQVIDAITQFYSEENANIHRGIYDLSNHATSKYESVRKTVADFLGAGSATSIGFTKGTTESINVVARSFAQNQLKAGDNIVTTTMEHHANFLPWQVICEENEAELRVVEVSDRGDLVLEQLQEKLSDKTKLLAINHISNTLGTINQVKAIIDLAHEKNVPVLIDAAQSAAYYDLDVQELDCDFLVFSGHKIFGPFGTGVLFVKEQHIPEMRPYNYGGGMIKQVAVEGSSFATFPHNLEAGTPSIADIIALGAAIGYINDLDKEAIRNQLKELATYGAAKLAEIPEVEIVGSPQERSGIISFTVQGIHPHDVASFLNKDEIAVRAGMHCTQPLLHQLNVPSTVRASFSIYNSIEEIDRLYDSLIGLIEFWKDE